MRMDGKWLLFQRVWMYFWAFLFPFWEIIFKFACAGVEGKSERGTQTNRHKERERERKSIRNVKFLSHKYQRA